jgi:pyruvate/2-oxoglutarate dehydrogenase complex dihydrolipoamide dehydrogenase (E3) component
VIVIGSGIAGLAAASTANALGKKVAVVESARFGGRCTWYNCLPLKALIHIANKRERSLIPNLEKDKSHSVFAEIKKTISRAAELDKPSGMQNIKVDVLFGESSFVDNHTLKIGERTVNSRTYIIATGSEPAEIKIEGLENVSQLNCETLYELEKLPESITIIGGGPDGVEFAQSLGLLGVKVCLVDIAPRILMRDDEEMTGLLTDTLSAQGIGIYTGVKIKRFLKEKNDSICVLEQSDGGEIRLKSEYVLVTAGRQLSVAGLQLENAGVGYTAKNIVVDSHMRTTARNIYACGDAVGPFQIVPLAEQQALIAGQNSCLPFKKRVNNNQVIGATFTNPPLASTGLTEKEARTGKNKRVRVYRCPYHKVRRAILEGNESGLAKVITDTKGRILGAHIYGYRADEIIHEFHLVRVLGKPLHSIHNVSHAFPTYTDSIVKRLSDMAFVDQMKSNIWIRLALKLLPGYKNRLETLKEVL